MINRLAEEVEADLAGRPALLRDASSRALGRAAMRGSVSGWNTTEHDIDRSVAAVTACATR